MKGIEMSKKKNILVAIVIVTIVLVSIVLLQPYQANASPGIPNSPDAQQIMAVMDRAYQLIGHASQSFDVSEFSAVFVDTDDYEITDEQRDAIAATLGVPISDVGNIGYLTAMQLKYVSMGQGASLLREAMKKAKAENRQLSPADLQELAKANHGKLPSLGSPVTKKTVLTFESIEIEGDRASVRYDDGAALQEAILVKVNGKWLIASIKPIWIHF